METETTTEAEKRSWLTPASPAFKTAAIAYFVYGIIYMGGASHLGLTGSSARAMESNSWVWYAIGAAFTIGFPILIYRGYVWFTRGLILLMAFRVYGLVTVALGPAASDVVPLMGESSISKGLGSVVFAAVATVTAIFLLRAVLPRGGGEEPVSVPQG